MTHLLTPQPNSTLDQLDQRPHQTTRGHDLNHDPFRRQHHTASSPHTTLQGDTPRTDADTKLCHELNLAFADLGGAAFALAHHGALNDKRLAPQLQRIHQLYAQLDAHAHNTPVDPADDQPSAENTATA
jgi:hypothetical protein